MEPIVLKCPSCGGGLEFESSLEFGFCKYCGSKVMIPKKVPETVINNFPDTTRFFLLTYQSGDQTQHAVKDEITIVVQYRNNAASGDPKPLGAKISSNGLDIPNKFKLSSDAGVGTVQITGLGNNLTISRESKVSVNINGMKMETTSSRLHYGDLISISSMILRVQPLPSN